MKPHRAVRNYKSRPHKFNGKCEECGKSLCSCKAYQYVDGNNAAISNNSPYVCSDCAKKLYGITIKTPEQAYKQRLLDFFSRTSERAAELGDLQLKDFLSRVISTIERFD